MDNTKTAKLMIEKCSYCGEEHETGEGLTFHGTVIKSCPELPVGWVFNPQVFDAAIQSYWDSFYIKCKAAFDRLPSEKKEQFINSLALNKD